MAATILSINTFWNEDIIIIIIYYLTSCKKSLDIILVSLLNVCTKPFRIVRILSDMELLIMWNKNSSVS